MNTAAAQQQPPKAGTTNQESSEEQAFLAEVKKLEDTARQYQSEVSQRDSILTMIEQICGGHRHLGRTTKD